MSFLTYRLILSAGVGVGTLIALACGARRNLPRTDVFDAVLGAAVAGMAIGRVAYVALNWSYFQTHLLEAAQLWRGGLWAPAVVAGAILGAAVVAWQRRLDLRDVLDALAPAAAAVAVAAWLGCLQRGCAWGLELWPHQTLLWPLRVELPDLYGLVAPRLPVQIAGAAWSGVLLAVSLLVKRRGRGAIVAIAGRFRPAVERPKRLERFTNPGRL
ncbi:MAG: prolipoprotein diacylglyceryl transferase, partial [Anaerolineae bacterium]|nr:prolipoprotein diacylglyceryl transferase [Anaerolineae bacterium]